ncbi:MAG: helix-turn-helix domain-containing protein, partial [Deltaproteobacteria bacterium]|nr:helix-turn-helix domain-containing protein [Deltaproteobacteria bacterium]
LCKRQTVGREDLLLEHEPLHLNYSLPYIEIPPGGVSLKEVEKSLIEQALSMAHGNRTRAAELLKISRNTLRYRMEKYSIHPDA